MHPPKTDLRRYIDGLLEDKANIAALEKHLDECEFCRDYCDNYRELISIEDTPTDSSAEFDKLAGQLYQNAFNRNVIKLFPISFEEDRQGFSLAADGEPEKKKGIYSLATLASDDPEIILRLMHDSNRELDYIQLISEDPKFTSNVMIEIPEIDREIISDINGRAELESGLSGKISEMKWQIRLPDADFTLSPVKYDPDKTEYETEQILETDRDDKILIRFEGKTGGKKISLKLIQIEGKTEFGPVRVSVSQNELSLVQKISNPGQEISFDLTDPEAELFIRLFTDE